MCEVDRGSKSQTRLMRNREADAKMLRTVMEEEEADISTEGDQQLPMLLPTSTSSKLDTGMCPLGFCDFSESHCQSTPLPVRL